MCAHDLVVFESGVHDMAFFDRRAHRALLHACTGPLPCDDAQLMPAMHNESWRLDQLSSYRANLGRLMEMWRRCARTREARQLPPFRPIFKLISAPNSGTELSGCNAEWGYNTEAHYMQVANAVAREVVEGAGFEVFDAFSAALHAMPQWYDEGGRDNQHSDVLSDLVTQMLLNQICAAPQPGGGVTTVDGKGPRRIAAHGGIPATRRGHIGGLPRQFSTFSRCPAASQSVSPQAALTKSKPT